MHGLAIRNRLRHAEIWLLPYLKERIRRFGRNGQAQRVWVSVTDHYEPLTGGASLATALMRVGEWRTQWPKIASRAPRDASGQMPQYSFFYPQEKYHHEILEGIADMVRQGIGDVEVHLHHRDERPEAFERKIKEFCARLSEDHGLLRQLDGRTVFGFIHGNWALDNALPGGAWCGLNGEIRLLSKLGCYADFTLPSAPSPAQGRVVNQIYWCTANPDDAPRSFDKGIEARPGGGKNGDLLIITGPLGLRYANRLLPRIETGEIADYDLPTRTRVSRWFDLAPMIGQDIFIKLYTHGAQDGNRESLLTGSLEQLFGFVAEEADDRRIELHWASAWQMYQAAAEIIGSVSSTANEKGQQHRLIFPNAQRN